MTIPNDPERRWWAEVSGANSGLVDDLRPALVAFVAFTPNHKPSIEGSGFITAASNDIVLLITAKHVLFEGVLRTQRPLPKHVASSLFIQKSTVIPSIDPKKMRIIWMGAKHAALLIANHVGCNDTLDAACLVCSPQDSDVDDFRPTAISIDTSLPSVGDTVYLIAHDKLEISELWRSGDRAALERMISIEKRISIRVGVVTNIYPAGQRQFRWPCFTTSIPAEPGMSGGLVVLPREGNAISACGLVCADSSTEEARSNCHQCGESVIACMWPLLSLPLPETYPSTPETELQPLYEMMRLGRVPMATGGIEHINLIDLGNGNYRFVRSDQLDDQ